MNTSNWSGGTTTQLAIYPLNTSYKDRNFLFRLSSARVETPTSTFTPLPGISRVIMILDGELKLSHKDHYTKTLKQFETDNFEGSWNTSSIGKVTDFNLMTTPQASGTLNSLHLSANTSINPVIADNNNVIAYYSHMGSFSVIAGKKNIIAEQGDLILLFTENPQETHTLKTHQDCHIIVAEISIP